MKYNDLDLGTIEAVVNKIGGIEGVKNFLANKTQVLDIAQAIHFRVWEKIKVGVYKDLDDLYSALISSPRQIISNMIDQGYDLKKILVSVLPILLPEEKEVKLINVSPLELGVKNGFLKEPGLEEIRFKAKRSGLLLCSEEMAFQLALQYQNSEKLRVYIPTKSGVFGLFQTSTGLLLNIYAQALPTTYAKKDRFIFCIA